MKNTVYMLNSVDGNQMGSQIIATAEGRLIVIDGGFDQDAEKLIGYLKKLSGAEVPHVDAWILSHPHTDHISAFLYIMETMPQAVTIDQIYYNFPSAQCVTRLQPWVDTCLDRFYKDLPLFADKVVIVTLGDTFDVGDAHFECLYSPNPELTVNVINNASLILKMTLGGKSVMWLADAGPEEGERLMALYGDTDKLKSDVVQMAHHGQGGVEKDVYAAISPSVCLWNTPKWLWDNDAGKGYNTHCWKTFEVKDWMEELGVRDQYIMWHGDQVVEL